MANGYPSTGPLGFPDPLADRKTKDSKAYILQYAKAMHNSFTKYGLRILSNDKTKYRNLANYYQGLQQIDRYKKLMDVWNEDEAGKDSFLNINWQVLNLAYKFVNIMVDKIVSTGYDVQLQAIDPLALDLRKEIEHTMKAVMDNKEWLTQMGIQLNAEKLGFDPESLPDHSDGLQIHMEMSVKDEFAMEGEMAINMHMNNNDFEHVRKEYNRDAVVYGIMCVESRNERKTGYTKIKRISPEQTIIGNSRSEDFKDVGFGGYVEAISFQELQSSAKNQFTEDEYLDIYQSHSSALNTDAVNKMFLFSPNLSQNSGEKMVQVMKFYYKVDIQNTYVKKKDSRGNSRLYPQGDKKKENTEHQVIRDSYEVVYEGMWIVGSDYIYDYGMMTDMEVDSKNPCATRIPIHVIYPNMLNGMSNSILQSCLPIFDAINLSWYNFQNMMAQIVPDGVAINQDALADIALGSGGKRATPKELMSLYYKKGTYIYSGRGMDGQNGNGVPFTQITNGNHEKAMSHLNMIFTHINILRQLTGMNEGVDASTPSPDALVGTMQIAAQGANSALGFLYGADRLMVKHVSESLILLTQAAVRRGEVSGYIDSVGVGATKFWSINKGITLRQFGMKIVVRPTEAEWREIYQDIKDMLAKGILDYSSYSVIKEMTNLKEARKYMAVVEKRKKREAILQQEAATQQQGDMNIQVTQASEQMKQQTLQMEIQMKTALAQTEGQIQMAILDKKYGYDIQLKQMEMQQKAESADTVARTKIVDTTMKNENELQKTLIQAEKKKKETATAK